MKTIKELINKVRVNKKKQTSLQLFLNGCLFKGMRGRHLL